LKQPALQLMASSAVLTWTFLAHCHKYVLVASRRSAVVTYSVGFLSFLHCK